MITVTEQELSKPSAAELSLLSSKSIEFFPYTLSMVAMENPPANALKWIGRTAGKSYPYTFLAASDGAILWQGATPKGLQELTAVLSNLITDRASECICPGGVCPQKVRVVK